jgi:NAD-reducing hydrogenase large subunit
VNTLEKAEHPAGLKRIAIEPVSRVEGHGKVTILLDDQNRVHQVRLHIVEFRGFERFIQGRPYWEVPVMVQRLCGICPVSHHLAASKALDMVVGARRITPTAEKLRRLMHYGQILQSHALHFYHLSSPDLLFGFDAPVAIRNVVGVLQAYPEAAKRGVMLRKFGQEVIRITAGKRVHGTGSVPGGVNKCITPEERDLLAAGLPDVLRWADEGIALVAALHGAHREAWDRFGTGALEPALHRAAGWRAGSVRRCHPRAGRRRPRDRRWHRALGLRRSHPRERALVELHEVPLPAVARRGARLVQGRAPGAAAELRLHPTPRAEAARQAFAATAGGQIVHAPLAFHWARMIELSALGRGHRRAARRPRSC